MTNPTQMRCLSCASTLPAHTDDCSWHDTAPTQLSDREAAERYRESASGSYAENDAFLAGILHERTQAEELVGLREKQIEIAIEYLEKYRTLVISHGVGKRESPTYRLGSHAEEALNLMAALNAKHRARVGK